VQQEPGLLSVAPYRDLPRLYLAHNAADVDLRGNWYRNFFYRVEQERGLDAVEDLFHPLTLRFLLTQTSDATVIASTERQHASHAAAYREAELQRRKALQEAVVSGDDFARTLAWAADQFLVRRGGGTTVIAGYPWFTDWGRDTMIALPGLTLFTGKAHLAKDVLLTFAGHVDQGMLPNRFPDRGETAEFNTVDATLWYFEAIRAYGAATGDYALIQNELYPVLASILDWHIKGTRYGIRMLADGLLSAGEPGVQLTWMDAKFGDWVVTPRSGQPVEIQALWYNALKVMEEFAARFGDAANRQRCQTISAATRQSFNRLFWNEHAGCLYDVVDGGAPDAAIRPNQVLAVSLPHSMLGHDRARQVVDVVERELLTPVGLRTLSPNSPAYRPRYQGSPLARDSAYHQGTVWAWLLGPFITAYVKVNGGAAQARRRAEQMLSGVRAHLSQAGLGQISEIFDADAPHLPRGCFAQAWSVAEILRAWCEDVLQVRPGSRKR
jgi:predicted glycogen debranching enzyme